MIKNIEFIKANCTRCRKEIVTASHSLWGLDKQKKELGIICNSCITPKEQIEILTIMGRSIQQETQKALRGAS